MTRTRMFAIGLWICVLIAVLDLVGLAGIGMEDAPPPAIIITAAVLGAITLAGAVPAWRGRKGGIVTVVVSRVLSALLGLPVFVMEAPTWARFAVAMTIVLAVVGVVPLINALRRPAAYQGVTP